MYGESTIPEKLATQFDELGIDRKLTMRILGAYNAGRYDSVQPVHVSSLPQVDGKVIIDLTTDLRRRLPLERAEASLERLGAKIDLRRIGAVDNGELILDRGALAEIGRRLYPLLSYGILNGGSATSYTDTTKNGAFSRTILDICSETFDRIAREATGHAKGITPGFVQPDGSPGPSYVELKMRSLLVEELRFQALTGRKEPALSPMFQMTSVYNDEEIAQTYEAFRKSPVLAELIDRTGMDVTRVRTGVQPMIAAFTHEREGRPKRLFTEAFGERDRILALPGGHGQNFEILRSVYEELYRNGKRFVVLGNVDNLGNTIDPVELALVALEGKQAGFDFAFKTPVDVKGGILVVDQRGRLDCADIGPAISHEEVLEAEATGTPILFNCATGLFDLGYLVENLDSIIDELPIRFSNQEKDAGAYSQAEQVTWEIIGMLDDFFVFGVDKYDRFLAAKLLVESLMTSGIGLDDPRYPTDADPAKDLRRVAAHLHRGLERKLAGAYAMRREGKRWVPLHAEEIPLRGGH